MQPLNLSHSLHDGLVASWRAYKWRAGGPTLAEEVGGHNASLLANSSWSPLEPPGGTGSISCDGSTSCGLLVPDSPVFALPSFTISVWAYIVNTSNYQCLMARGEGNGAARDWGLFLVPGTTGQVYLTENGNNLGAVSISPGYTLNAWNHFAYTYAMATGAVDIFINRALAYSGTASTATVSAGYLSIGAEIGAGSPLYPLTGEIGAADLWSRPLSAAEVQTYYDLIVQGDSDLFNYQ